VVGVGVDDGEVAGAEVGDVGGVAVGRQFRAERAVVWLVRLSITETLSDAALAT
jgi:hypothetical protein